MTVGELLASFKEWAKELIDSLPIKEYVEKAIKEVMTWPGKMADSFTEIITEKQWGWLFSFVFWVVVVVILWKALANIMDMLTDILLFVACGVLGLAFLVCVVQGRFDIAMILILLIVIALVKRFFFPPPPSPPPAK